MQRNKQQREISPIPNVMGTILQSIPKEAEVTKIEYEGPRIAIYTKNPRFLMEHNDVISNMVNVIKKRIVVRTEESIRKNEEEARQILTQMLPKDTDLRGTFFDTA
ncbi:MAG TPA: beta-CASP ribonuclease aCPSF1, partial [Candidatus Bathyarchaeia archaeon]|nr:beta-CASP ribonuclease aCPSF1 [Candidatus Bathyarchaeia archaeon]